MTSQEIQAKCKEYREMKRMAEEAQGMADSIADELKALMTAEGQTTRIEGQYKLSFADRSRKDINKKALQEAQPEVYAAFLTETSYKVFTVR